MDEKKCNSIGTIAQTSVKSSAMPDNFNWLESTQFTIEIAHKKGQLKSPTAKIHFEMEDGYKTAIADADVALQRNANAELVVALPEVKDDAASYRFYYTIKADDKDIYESDWFYVWPMTLDLTATYKKGDGDTSTLADGAVVPGFPFNVSQVDETGTAYSGGPFKTTPQGTRIVPVNSKGPVTIVPRGSWEIVEPASQADAKRKRELKVRMRPWTAKILSHTSGKTEDAPVKQIVNETQDYATSKGSLVKVQVGPLNLTDAVKDQEIKVRVTFPATNCKRSDPFPAMWTGETKATAVALSVGTAKPGVAELKYEAVVKIPNDNQAAVFYVEMGVAGGDKCKIEVGVTDTYGDDKLFLQNWRKIALELLVADLALRQKCASVLADTGAAFGDDLKTELNRIFTGTFIEFDFPTNACVTLAAADFKKYFKGKGTDFDQNAAILDSNAMFVSNAKFKLLASGGTKISLPAGGDKVFLFSDYQSRPLRKTKLQPTVGARAKNVMTWTFCDFIQDRSTKNVVGAPPAWTVDMSTVHNYFVTIFEGVDEKQVDLPFYVFDLDPLEASGKTGATGVEWQAVAYKKKGATVWTDIGADTDPGGAHKNPTKVSFTAAGAAPVLQSGRSDSWGQWVEIVDSATVKLKLPKTAPADPGNLLKIKRHEPKSGGGTEEVEYDIKISADYRFHGIEFSALGGAVSGQGFVRTGGGRVTVLGMAQTLAHEILHNCGQTYTGKVSGEIGGWSNPAVEGVPFGAMFPAGPYYVGKGHQGSHCAKALLKVMESATAEEKAAVAAGKFSAPSATHKTAYFSKVKQTDQCIMYGDGPEMATDSMDLCDACKTFVIAMDLSDVSKVW